MKDVLWYFSDVVEFQGVYRLEDGTRPISVSIKHGVGVPGGHTMLYAIMGMSTAPGWGLLVQVALATHSMMNGKMTSICLNSKK